MFKRLLLTLGLLIAASSGAWAQNTQCSNRPAGDSSNACANTRFVQATIAPFFITCPANQWVNAIGAALSVCAQPAFSNISGQAALAQLPTIGANTVLGSIVGGTPIALSQTQLTSLINPFTSVLSGAVPASGGGTTTFLRADATFATPAINSAPTPQGRITLTSNTPITTTDVTGATIIYYTPLYGNLIPLYDGSSFTATNTAGQLSVTLGANWATNTNYDWFIGLDGATVRFCSGPAWTSDTGRGSGAGTTELVQTSGLYLNTVSITCRYANASTFTCAASRCTYVGSSRTVAAGQMEDSLLKRFVYNAYNQANRPLLVKEATASWSWSTASYHQVNASAANQVAYLAGLTGSAIQMAAKCLPLNSTSTIRIVYCGIGIDSTTVNGRTTSDFCRIADGTVPTCAPSANYSGFALLGYHYIAWLEKGAGSDTQTWFGVSGSDFQTGMFGSTFQ